MNVREAAQRVGVSVRTLHYYEEAGLIAPARNGENGYRIYDEETILRARRARVYREMQIPLKEIRALLDASPETRDGLLEAQVRKLEIQRERIDNRIALINGVRMLGAERLTELDIHALDDQMAQARRVMEENPLVREMQQKGRGRTPQQWEALGEALLRKFAQIAGPDGEEHIAGLRTMIEENYYPCTDEILLAFSRMYGGDGVLGQHVDAIGGAGTARRARQRIETWLNRNALQNGESQ